MCAKYVLNKDQQEALHLLSTMTTVSAFDEREKNLVAKLLADCMLDSALNEAVRGHLRPAELAAQPHVDIFSVAFNARQWEKFDAVYTQFSGNFAKITKGEKLVAGQSLKDILSQYAIIRGAARLFNDFNHLQEKGLLRDHPELLELHEKIKKCHEMVDVLDKKFMTGKSAKPGLFTHDERSNSLSYFQSLQTTFNVDDQPKQQFRPK